VKYHVIFGISRVRKKRDILRRILCNVKIHSRFVPGFEKSSVVHSECSKSDVKMVFQSPAPSSRQSALLPECFGLHGRGPDGVAA